MTSIITALTTENAAMYNFIAYPLCMVEILVMLFLIKTIYNVQTTMKQNLLFISLCTIIGCSIRLFLPIPFNFIFNIIAITLIIIFTLKVSFFKSIVTLGIFLVFNVISEYLVFFFLSQSNMINVELASSIPIYKIFCCLSVYSIVFTFIVLARALKGNFNISDNMSKKDKLETISNILVAIIILYPNMIFLIIKDMNIPSYYIVYNFFCAIVIFLLATFNTHKFNKFAITKRELDAANLYNKTLNDLVDANRTFKHDINNVTQAIGGYIELNDMEGLKEYYSNGLIPEITKVNNLSLINHNIINSPPVFGLILSKYNLAITKEISITLTSFFDYAQINMNIFDFTKILGILLDNAIDASSLCDEKKIDIHVSVDFYNRKQIFKISNTYINKDVDLNKIFEKNFSTKKRKSGIGLWEVRKIINKYDNVSLYTTKDDNFFTQKLDIFF